MLRGLGNSMIKTLLTAAISLLILDALWLGWVAKPLYMSELGSVARFHNGSLQPIWLAAVLVYIALVAGIMLFVVPKAQGDVLWALIYGGLFGMIVYGVYDFTNLAVLKDWRLMISIIDVIWGTILCSISSALATWVQ